MWTSVPLGRCVPLVILQAFPRRRRGVLAVATLIAGVIGAGQVVSAQSASAVSTQHVVFSHSGAQTASSYFEPVAQQPADYTSPNLAQGRAYVRIQVTSKPSHKPMQPMVCFWRHGPVKRFQFETCASTSGFTFSERGTYWLDLGAPASWWKLNGVYDWSQPASVVRIMLKDPATGSLLLSSKCGAACYRGDDLADHVPVQMTAELVMVVRGATLVPLDQWRASCPTTWSPDCGTGGGGGSVSGPDLTVTGAAGSFTARWPAVAGAKRYQLRYRPVGGEMVSLPAFTERTRTVDGLTRGTAYDVWVRAFVGDQWSDWSRQRVDV